MMDTYRIPVLALLCVLAAVFGMLYLRVRTIRSFLWLLGWTAAALQLVFLQASPHAYGLFPALAESCIQVAALMFLGSLSPLKLKHHDVHYVTLFALPLIFYSFLALFTPHPDMLMRAVMLLSDLAAVGVAVAWSLRENLLPPWFTTTFALVVGGLCIYAGFHGDDQVVLNAALAGNTFITALLVITDYNRRSPGVLFTVAGLVLWCLPAFTGPHPFSGTHSFAAIWLLRVFNMAKVVAAIGMIVLVLEDELAAHDEAKQNERRAHMELEEYARLDFLPSAAQEIAASFEPVCRAIAQYSRFARAALLLRAPDGSFAVAAYAGLEAATLSMLHTLSGNLDEDGLRQLGASSGVRFDLGRTTQADLAPLLPGTASSNEMTRPHLLRMRTREGALDGLLLLWGLKNPARALATEDILPIELLLSRLASARDHHLLARQVARTERLASLGQLAAGVAHELNNPLTVLMGYSEIMTEEPEPRVQKYAGMMLTEARRMKQIIESLVRFWRPSAEQTEEIQVEQLLRDLARLHRAELAAKGIELILEVQPGLPPVLGSYEQLQQVMMQLIQNAVSSLDRESGLPWRSAEPPQSRQIRIEARPTDGGVQMLISDNGPGFTDPTRVFDPFFTTKAVGEGVATGMGLSLCYTIVREHSGEITAWNREPHGACVRIELPSAAARALLDFVPPAPAGRHIRAAERQSR
ncbi:MAG TPA: two-component sensor histidine kinase [Acidobacterium sp.]|nr:two-component sensor histidine kinase [Acidobacterium sp.]